MNIVLTGFMASGKSAISKALHKLLPQFDLVDTDDLIVKETGKSINQIFEEMGEEAFREIEHNVICEVSMLSDTIISTGGGVVLNKNNIIALRKNGIIVNLAPDFRTIEERLINARSSRPLLKDSSINEIYERFMARKPFYDDCDIKIPVSNEHKPAFFAKNIIEEIKLIQE